VRVSIVTSLLLLLAGAQGVLAESISPADLLRRVIDLQRLTVPPAEGERTGTFSSVEPGAAPEHDDCGHYLETKDDGWHVLARLDGPGAITRIWSATPLGAFRVEVDGKVVVEAGLDALIAGQVPPFVVPLVDGRHNCYYPIGFGRSVRLLSRAEGLKYEVDYVRFADGTNVASFTRELDEKTQAAVAEVSEALRRGLTREQIFGARRGMPVAEQKDLGPLDMMTFSLEGAGTVQALYIGLTDRTEPREAYALHRCVLRVYVDDEDRPSIETPLCDFFGSGFDLVYFRSLVMGTNLPAPFPLPDRRLGEDRMMFCYFPMPYRRGMQFEIENMSADGPAIGLLAYLRVDTREPARDALRFHAGFRRLRAGADGAALPVLEMPGAGRLVGCVLNVDHARRDWWGAGDVPVWTDGAATPVQAGTGWLDWLGAQAWPTVHGLPLQGVTRAAAFGKTSAYRWLVSDAIVYHDGLKLALENAIPGGGGETYVSAVTYWYARPQDAYAPAALTLDDITPPGLRIPDAIEVEDAIVSSGWGTPMLQKYAGAELSGGKAANITTPEPIELRIVRPRAETVQLRVRANPARSFTTVTFRKPDGAVIGAIEYNRAPDGIYDVGKVDLAEGENRIIVQCAQRAVLDCLLLVPVAGAEATP
jgi:hypothetical protein